jgi:hypothetical protein
LLLVIHVYLDLLQSFGVWDGVAVSDFDFGAIFAADSEEGANDALLIRVSAKGMIEDGEYCLQQY